MFDSMIDGINNLIDWLTGIPAWLFSMLKNFLASLFDMLVDLFCFLLDALLQGVSALLALIPVPATTFNANQYLAGAPADFINMMIAIRMPEAFAIIVVALGIRFLLGLIPLIRVGG